MLWLAGIARPGNGRLRRGLGVHAGYGQEHVDLRAPDRLDYDSALIDVGVDFNRAFSVARRTTLGFNTSTSVIKYQGVERRVSGERRRQLVEIFSPHLAGIGASRAARPHSCLVLPSRSMPIRSARSWAACSRRDSSLRRCQRRSRRVEFFRCLWFRLVFRRRHGFRLRSASMSAPTVQYFAYWYEVPPNAFTLSVPGRMARQVVSVGLSFYVPVYEKVRQGQ